MPEVTPKKPRAPRPKKGAAAVKTAAPRKPRKKKGAAPEPRGLEAQEVGAGQMTSRAKALEGQVAKDGGSVLAAFRDPLGGAWQLLVALPLERVKPTPYQRDLSEAHVGRMTAAIGGLGRYLDPIIAVRSDDGFYWTPNGHHRTAAMRNLGARSITALLIPETEMAYKILALNTEKSHNLREKSLEVIRMARDLAAHAPRPERDYALEFEEPAFLTLGLAYEQRGRFSGGAYHPVLRRIDAFQNAALPRALELRAQRVARLFELDDAVVAAVSALKERGFDSPYLKAFVIARVNPLRFQRGVKAAFEATIATMLDAARRFDAAKVRADHVARAGGPPDAEA